MSLPNGKNNERESDIQLAICDYHCAPQAFLLAAEYGPRSKKGKTAGNFGVFPKYAMRGVPDIIVVSDGQTFFLAVKRRGSYHSSEQKEFQAHGEKVAAVYAVVRSIEDAQRLGL